MPHWSPANADLPSSGVTPGAYGDATNVGSFTVNAAGLITAAADVAITGGGGGGGIVQASRVVRTAGDLTTASTSFVDATGLTTTITTGAHRCLVIFSASGHNSADQANVAVDLAVDGSLQGQTYGLVVAQTTAAGTPNIPMGFTYLTAALSAGAHTLKIQWRVDFGTGTMFASTGVTPAILTVIELGI